MKHRLVWVFGSVAATIVLLSAGAAGAADIAPHRALYTMILGSARNDSGVVDARGTMDYEWGESCDGWTIEQRYRLKMRYGEAPDADIVSSFVTWESKDGLRYRFNQKQTRNGEVDQDIRGEARLDAPERGGIVEFTKPKPQTLKLEAGVLFPSSHTILLIDKAHEGENFLSRQVFTNLCNAGIVSAALPPGLALPSSVGENARMTATQMAPLQTAHGFLASFRMADK